MSKFQRVKSILLAVLMILIALILFLVPNYGFYIVVLILCIGLFAMGIKEIIYYFSMAIHMVGGKRSLYKGVIILEVALFAFSVYDVPGFVVILYLIGIHAFSGVVDLLRANESRKNGSKNYKMKLIHGIIDIVIALICAVFIKNANVAAYIYGGGLVYSAIMRIVMACRKTAIVYIQ